MKTVTQFRAAIDNHVRYWPSNALGTATEAVDVLERLTTAAPHEVFALLDELRGTTKPEGI